MLSARLRHFAQAVALAATALAGCSNQQEAPWLTYPGLEGHAAYFPLVGTSHDPSTLASVAGASTDYCGNCHAGTSFTLFVCTTCHTHALVDPIHVASLVPEYVASTVTSADCYRCHPQGAGMSPAVHATWFPIGPGTKHPAVCRSCHTDPVVRTDVSKLGCVGCHTSSSFADPLVVHSTAGVVDYWRNAVPMTPRWCLRCHADGRIGKTVAGHDRIQMPGGTDLGGPANHGTCFGCHTMRPPLFGGIGTPVPNRPWAQDWRQTRSCSGGGGCH